MSPGRTRRTRGISSVLTAVIMALAIIFIIAAIAISWPMIKSGFDKNYWSGSMGLYTLKFTNSSYAYAQNGAGGQVGSSPTPIGYCIAISTSTTYAVSTCPSTTPSYQSSSPSQQSPSLPSSNNGGGSSGSGGSSGGSSGGNNYYVYVTVTGDSYGAGWAISSSTASISGSSDVNMIQLQIGGPTDTLTAQITSNPPGYTCSISPSSESVTAGNSYTFTVSCQPTTYYVYVTVTGDSYGASWEISSSVSSINGMGNVNNQQLQIGGQTDTLTAQITSNPSGYQCSISPASVAVQAGQTVAFTVNCQPVAYYVYVTVTGDDYGASWQVSSSVASISGSSNVNNELLQIGGPTDTLTAQITYWNIWSYWFCMISPSSATVQAGQSITFSVSCYSPLLW
jgi:plastocyanin